MPEKFESSDTMLKSADSNKESADAARQHRPHVTSEQLNFKAKQREKQSEIHEEAENGDRLKAETDLENGLNGLNEDFITTDNLETFLGENFSGDKNAFEEAKEYLEKQALFGIDVTREILENHLHKNLEITSNLSIAEKIKNYKDELSAQGKPSKEILQTLIAKFENEDAVSTWVENWKNMLALHSYAQNKPPQERKAIQSIIANADLSSENSFDLAMTEIENSSEISAETKEEISLKFGKVTSVGGMDSTLNQLKDHKEGIENAISEKGEIKKSLEGEISDLKSKIENTEPFSTERKELEKQLEAKTKNLKVAESEIREVKENTPQNISFPLREGFTAELNDDGSRTIRIDGLNFNLKIPDNKMPFQGRKNMLTVNLAFNYSALHKSGMEGLFNPQLGSGDVPDKNHRVLSGKILTALGYPTDTILSNDHIEQLKGDLSVLKQKSSNTTGMEDATALGIYDISTQEINMNRLTECLSFIKQNRGKEIRFEELK
jgi:hypothetical protein